MVTRIISTHLRTIINNNKVCSFLSSLKLHHHYTVYTPLTGSSDNLSNTHLQSAHNIPPNLGKLVFSKWTSLLNHKVDSFSTANASLSELLLRIYHVCPGTCRKSLRVKCWEPVHMAEILLGFELGSRSVKVDVITVECLWEMFKRVGGRNEHLPKSYEIMGDMLVRVGMLREVEGLLLDVESRGVLVAREGIYSGLVEGYVNGGELARGLFMYDQMKGKGLVPSLSCCRSLIDVLVEGRKVDYAICVFEDLVEGGFEVGDFEGRKLEALIRSLCRHEKIKEARKLLRKIVAVGWKPSGVVLSEVACVYCAKKDFEDLLSFFAEMSSAPDVLVGNKIIHFMCSHIGIERTDSFLWELERLGFSPNEITFGILINRCCLDGKLRDAFVYLSEILSRGLKPDRHSYNAVISGLFKGGMQEHARDVLNEMIDNGIQPNLATFRALLAGFSRARHFNELKLLIKEMGNSGLVVLSPSEDLISRAFSVLGLNPLTVKLKRDNDVRNFRTEFVDELGNGLYLDTNVEDFEKIVTGVLEESLVPDFNFLVMQQCSLRNVTGALQVVDEMALWGQELSHPVLSALIRLICETSHTKAISNLVDKMVPFLGKMDSETLNLFLQTSSKMGFAEKSRLLLNEMDRKRLPITNDTYTSVLMGLCKLGRVTDMLSCWDIAWKGNWSPDLKDCIVVMACLCQRKMLKEVLEVFNTLLAWNFDSRMKLCDVLLEKLCCAGFTDVGLILVNELSHNCELDCTVYGHLIKGYCQEKRCSEALMIYDTYIDDSSALSSDSLLGLVPKLCKANRFVEAVALKDIGLRDHPSITLALYNALIKGCSRAGKLAETDVLFLEIFLKKILPDDDIYNNLLQGHCQNSDLKTAKELLCVMIRRNISFCLSSYRDLLCLLCRKGMFNAALGLNRLMRVESKHCCTFIYNILLFYLFRNGKYALVDALLGKLEKTGLQLDEVGYNILVHGFSFCRNMPRSMDYLKDMMVMGFGPSNRSLRVVICFLCSNGLVQDALQLTNQFELQGRNNCSTIHFALLEGLLSNGKLCQAESFLVQLMQKDLLHDTIIYNNLIKKFVQYGRLELAVDLLDQILRKRSIPDSASYDCIVERFCDFDQFDLAIDFLTEMLHRNLKPSTRTWEILIGKLCMNGQTPEAERLLISMAEIGETPTKKIYASVIDRYRFENNLSKASELLHKMQQHGYIPDFRTQWSLISNLNKSCNQDDSGGGRGFLSKLLCVSGFSSEGGRKSKRD